MSKKKNKSEKKRKKKGRSPETMEERGVALCPMEEYLPVNLSADENVEDKEKDTDSRFKIGIDRIKLICGFTVVFSLFAAVAVACYAFALSYGYISVPDEDEEERETEAESEKIVFVKPYDDNSGILTAPEIYEGAKESVVTVAYSFGSELVGEGGVCTGFIISNDGYIATAAHAVTGAEKLSVIEWNGKSHSARVVAADGDSDIALLKIEASGLKAPEIGDSEGLLTGERVYSIGTPASLDYAGTFFEGQVSYPLRTVTVYSQSGVAEKRLKLIQLDGKLNNGSSGSPVFDEYGKVIGMVTMRLSGDYEEVCFAVPATGAMRVLSAMINGRELNDSILSGVLSFAASLGIVGESYEENGTFGVKIRDFESDSAARGVLKTGDLITRVDNTEIRREGDLAFAVSTKNRGDTARVTVLRGGQCLTFEVKLN